MCGVVALSPPLGEDRPGGLVMGIAVTVTGTGCGGGGMALARVLVALSWTGWIARRGPPCESAEGVGESSLAGGGGAWGWDHQEIIIMR